MRALARYAWAVLVYNVAVITWGAYVRATGSGAGCGEHWPLCNGVVLPRSPGAATIIEFTHRLTSGIALLSVVILLGWTLRVRSKGDPARSGAILAALFIITEAAVGAGLVLFQLVADNATMGRAMFMAVHLVNTFFLLGALTLTAWWLCGGAPLKFQGKGAAAAGLLLGCVGLLLAGASGSVAALGDTLFPATQLSDALWADLSASSHVLIRLRVLHPVIAVTAGIIVAIVAPRVARGQSVFAERTARTLGALITLQLALGLLNIGLLAPVWLQLTHLLVADAIWIAFVLLGADALGKASPSGIAARAA